ncbi:DUF3857 domain-containing protein [Thalassomonas sp. RHCl1]|uniref:DUF3857 domain-containing protein n=1 Tax=Thalassomonas sp. RHCl1 TaxID=2995320 RepID=UPI00248A9886|nr:DUF3857 domain-containing protein [Thalassomonas sp. RHCl1]
MFKQKEKFLNNWRKLLCYFLSLVAFFLLLPGVKSSHANDIEDIHIAPVPGWVKIRSFEALATIPVDEITNGIYYRLLDNQIQVLGNGQQARYNRYVETVVNQKGVESNSQINLSYDPSYQKLVVNSLFILRDGKRLDRLPSAKISIFNREQELEQQIYNGSMTLNILLDDLREGDTLDYSFTRYGSNPVYQNRFSGARTLNWSVPVHDQYLRILWGKAQPLYINTRNINPEVQQRKLGEFTEYQVHMHNEQTLDSSSEAPGWYDPYGVIYFSESRSWEDVVDWALPLYASKGIHPTIKALADEIKQQSENKAEQIAAALKYTQGKIRYVGLEMGLNSHLPTPAHETLALRYGDCKDKAVLFIAILRALDIAAHPALVDTEETKLLAEKPPAENRFNHVIVTLVFEGLRLWLDPTLRYQEGPLNSLYQPDYGYALILEEGQKALTSMKQEKHNSYSHIREKYIIPEDSNKAVKYTVATDYLGDMAQQKYSQIERDGKKKLSQDYENYYQGFYPKLTALSEVEIQTDKTTGILSIDEQYSIEDFWNKGKKGLEVNFYPQDIRNEVFKPEQLKRNAPLSFVYPNNINHQLVLAFEEDGWDFTNEELVEDNAFFFFKRSVDFKDNTLTVNFEFSAKTDHIPPEQVENYMAARKELRQRAYYGIVKYAKDEQADETSADEENELSWFSIITLVYLGGIVFILISWRLESGKRPMFATSHFYPISLTKFLLLSMMTFGIYSSYWMYRNWKFIQRKDNEAMMPIARGLFSAFWFYPLFNALKQDSESRFKENKVLPSFLAALIAITYFVISLLLSNLEHIAVSILYFMLPLLFTPFVLYINKVNSEDREGYEYNSKWHFRSIVSIALFLPLWVITLAEESHLTPSSSVVTEDGIMSRDMNFLYRQKILPMNEKINYFYSDALFSIRDDGNGFTDQRVFSYWLDESDKLQKEIVTFDQIKDIEVKYAKDELSNTIITITRLDDSNFMLFVAAEEKGDRLFVDELKALWKRQS